MLRQAKLFICLESFCPRFKFLNHKNSFFFSDPPKKDEANAIKPPEYYDPKARISNNDFLKMELSQNPEFDKAFPYLRHHKKPSTLFAKNEEHDYIDSLRCYI